MEDIVGEVGVGVGVGVGEGEGEGVSAIMGEFSPTAKLPRAKTRALAASIAIIKMMRSMMREAFISLSSFCLA